MNYRPRHIETKLRAYAEHFKIVLVVGARQTGKSTLLRNVFPQLKVVVFDPIQDLYGARRDPDLFLNNFPPPIILDEIQYVPELLPAIKRAADATEKNGQYFLTGSQNLSVLKSVAESMAGRVGILQLDSMTPEEIEGEGAAPVWLDDYLAHPESPATILTPVAGDSSLLRTLWRGGMPGLLDMPDHLVPDYFRSYLQTYVERDVRLLENIRELAEFDRFLGLAGALSGQEINASQLGRDVSVSPLTARRWLDLLTNTYQWIDLFPYHGSTIKRLSGKRKGCIRDSGFTCYLQRISTADALAVHPLLGSIFEAWVIGYLHRQCSVLSAPPQMYHWRTGAGAEVDLVLERDGTLYPIEVKCKTSLSRQDLRGLRSFRETYPSSRIAPALMIYAGREIQQLDPHTVAIPWSVKRQG